MPALITLALSGAALITGAKLFSIPRRKPLVQVLKESANNPNRDPTSTSLKYTFVEVNTKYHKFIQNRVNPLLGQKRHEQINLLAADNQNQLVLSDDEKLANNRLALGGMAFASAVLGFINPLFTGVAICFGFLAISHDYRNAYRQLKEERKFTGLHILCVYMSFLWLGGYVAIAALGVLFFQIGFKIKVITENQSRHNLLNLFQIQPDKVWIRHEDGLEITVPFDQLQIGDTIVLQAGQRVPVDGAIIAGMAVIDQHMLTGESQPVEKTINDSVLASTIVLSGKIDVRVEKTGSETTAGQIMELLNKASDYTSAQSLKAIEMVDNLAWPTLAFSLISFPIVGIARAISLMGANTTVASYLSNPLAVLNFLNIAAKQGVLIKDGVGLETMAQVDTVVFDKTGTLTIEKLTLVQIYALSNFDENEILTLAAIAEIRQTHPIAQAIIEAAQLQQLEIPAVEKAHYEMGYGLKVWLDQGLVRVGSHRFMDMEAISTPSKVTNLIAESETKGHSSVLVALNDELIGCIELKPMIRPETQRVVTALQEIGLSLYIVSGDQEAPTCNLAKQLNMTGYFANVLPEEKANLVAQLQKEGRVVCLVGDGINDALAMRQADVSISLRGATNAATDTAQIILMEGNLRQLPYFVEISQKFQQNLKTNYNFTLSTSLFIVGGILFAGFTFAATELFFVVSLLGSLGIAMKPILEDKNID